MTATVIIRITQPITVCVTLSFFFCSCLITFFVNSIDSDNEDTPRSVGGSSKKERFFWQYNVQSKGPKGTRLVIKTQAEDPHVLNAVTDPVFSPNCSVRGIKVIKVRSLCSARSPINVFNIFFFFQITAQWQSAQR